mmetsp:Transcript_16133/g.46312  ORF Transcript_16133/g.46312 Transcript_16133/m.46312 type:complete len:233 (-) Transcript_16133:62-760(-)
MQSLTLPNGAFTGVIISPRPVQYAVPCDRKKVMSDPSSPDHSTNSSCEAGRPSNSFAPNMAAAALPLPPPSPAWAGTCFTRLDLNFLSVLPVFSLTRSNARSTRLVRSSGTPGMLHMNSSSSTSSPSSSFRWSISPKATVWKREARSWNPSGRLRMMRRNRLILHGEKSDRSYSDASISSAVAGVAVVAGARNAVPLEVADDGAKPEMDATWRRTRNRIARRAIFGMRRTLG